MIISHFDPPECYVGDRFIVFPCAFITSTLNTSMVLQLDLNGRLIRWLEPFLMGRILCQSKCRFLPSSNQQESVICPVLLFLYTNVGLTHSCPVYWTYQKAFGALYVYIKCTKSFRMSCLLFLAKPKVAKMQQVCSHSTHEYYEVILPSTWCLTQVDTNGFCFSFTDCVLIWWLLVTTIVIFDF